MGAGLDINEKKHVLVSCNGTPVEISLIFCLSTVKLLVFEVLSTSFQPPKSDCGMSCLSL